MGQFNDLNNTSNIWEGLDFKDASSKSVFEYLSEQSSYLETATEGELTMEVESVDAYLEEEPIILVGLYKLFVVAPKLGLFRRKILTVIGNKKGTRFPVDIYCHIDEQKEEGVLEDNFINKINEILLRQPVKTSIMNLFKQSKESF